MTINPVKTSVFEEGDNLVKFIVHHVPKLPNKSILVVTSKIVALAEKRTAQYQGLKAKEKLIKSESQWALRTKYVWATLKDGALVASAGIDESNGNGKLILLPFDSMRAAENLRKKLRRIYKIFDLGLLITDSRIAPLRAGVLGIALGYAGFAGLRDYRGKLDIFGRKLKYTQTNIADSLATAATLIMGEGRERHSLAIISRAPVEFITKVKRDELKIDIKDDMYGPLFKSFPSNAAI